MAGVYNVPDLAPGETYRAEELIHRSRFIVSLARVRNAQEAKAFVETIKAQHPQANHNCWAYVAGPAGSTAQVGCSDDGEPKGTAGRPMLTVLLHCGVGEVAAVVTRYFGGILLGTGGLVRAYQGLTKLGLEGLPLVAREEQQIASLTIEHSYVTLFQRNLAEVRGKVLKSDFAMDVTFTVSIPSVNTETFLSSLVEKTAGAVLIESVTSEEAYLDQMLRIEQERKNIASNDV